MPGPIQSGISSALSTATIVAAGAKQIKQEEEKAKLEATQAQKEVAGEMKDEVLKAMEGLDEDKAKAQEKYHVKSSAELAKDSFELSKAGEQELADEFLNASYDFNTIAFKRTADRLQALRNSPGWKVREAFLNAPSNRKELNNYLMQLSQLDIDKIKDSQKPLDDFTTVYGGIR